MRSGRDLRVSELLRDQPGGAFECDAECALIGVAQQIGNLRQRDGGDRQTVLGQINPQGLCQAAVGCAPVRQTSRQRAC